MVRRDRLRRVPGATLASSGVEGAASTTTASRRATAADRSTLCAGRPARPLPAGLILAMAATAGGGNVVCAFAPIASIDWPGGLAGGGGRPDGSCNTNLADSRGWWPQLTAVVDRGGRGVAARVGEGRRSYGARRRERSGRRRGQTWLANAQPGGEVGNPNGDAGPSQSANGPATTEQAGREPQARGPPVRQGRGVSNGNSTPPRASQSRAFSRGRNPRGWGAEARPRTTVFNGVRRGGGKRGTGGQGRGRGGQGRDSGGAAEMEGQGKTLKELVMFDQILSQKSPPAGSAAASNKTELSAKVEAELFEEYDAMVPGPAASAVGNNAGGDGAGQERTGRPLKINLDLLSYQAKQKNMKGNYREARRLYRTCVELDPRDGRGWLGLARQMQKIHKYDKAQRLFEAGLENCADNPYLLQAFAVMEEQRGNQAKALTLLNRSVRMHPEHTASWVALGLLNERNKRIDEARGCFQTATRNDPRNHYAWLVWAMLEKRIGSIDVAREKFKMCLKVNPRNAKVYQAWGVLEASEGSIALATELFRAGLEQRPDNTYIMQAWALMEAKQGNTDAAISLFKEAILKRPRDGAVWQAYALLLKDMGDVAGARALFSKGTTQSPKHCPTWQAWGMLEWELGQISRARKLFQEGVWGNPKGPYVVRILQAWGILEATQGNWDDARKYFGFALARDPYSLPVMVAWALMEEYVGDIGRARQLFEIATTTQADNADIWNVYEQVEMRAGFPEEAVAVYQRGVVAVMAGKKEPPPKERGPSLLDPATARGPSLLDEASRSLSMSSTEMALEVSRIIGGVQWASDYMTFSALNSSSKTGGERMAYEP
ncbi:PsbB mRNA maturation factor Mbb1 [Ectocarpus siliculosus]|uniref:PsbB mRNA maturation factor Mbb1 n=1 Tax=Ectocarpus siliculosus TaxID=2880 RepID=D7FP63_ECTSI|nr:PsbB mRNA maturation factor Mbb1 [Ectocarpus siliculosus]|eukprot:CBJ30324.1 PsbB mRNA maturation factor Mbb1 [Ectocarpus siliculosus]